MTRVASRCDTSRLGKAWGQRRVNWVNSDPVQSDLRRFPPCQELLPIGLAQRADAARELPPLPLVDRAFAETCLEVALGERQYFAADGVPHLDESARMGQRRRAGGAHHAVRGHRVLE